MTARARWLLTLCVMACDSPARSSPAMPAADAQSADPPATAPMEPRRPTQPTPTGLSAAVSDIVGPATAEVLRRGTDRATFVIDAAQFVQGSTDPARFAGYPVLRRGRPLTDGEHRRLVALLLDDASYHPVEREWCDSSEAYGLRVGDGAEVVELALVFPCARVSFLRRASADSVRMPGEYIDPVAPELLAMLRAATRP